MASGAFSWLLRRATEAPARIPKFPYNVATNPYQCKRKWPPDFTKLSHLHQFRLERRYRRRSKLKFARPIWTKATKLVQWTLITGFVVYGVLFMEVDDRIISPFQGIRDWYQEQLRSLSGARERTPVASSGTNVKS